MQCEDNSKLRIPLSEVCKTTDIGCVPITNGKPTCTPQPDELPIAFDPSSTTLWLFSCKTHDWVAFQKFKLDQLSKMNLDNIRNICEVLNIAVWYDSGSAHVQGTVTLAQFGEELLKCIQLKTKTLIVERDTVKVWVDGLDKLPPYFVKGNNIWFEGGSGTETDPLRVATYDPICKWPTKSQAQVDAANVKHLGACLDGQMSRVPFPPEVCELPSKSEAQVRASANKQMIACIDGEGAKVPFPKEVCELDGLSQEQVDASTNKTLIACVNGKGAKVPYIESDPPICELPLVTTSQVSSAGNNATLALCLNGKSSRMPVPSGMFVPEYICVPKVTAKPTSPPDFGTGPLRMGCNNELFVWLCNENRWEGVIPDHNVFRPLDPSDVANIEENLHFAAWYPAGSDECTQNVYVNIKQLIDLIGGNELMKEAMEIVAADAANICKFPTTSNDKIAGASVGLCVDGQNAKASVSNLASALGTNSNLINSVTNSSGFGTKVNEIVKTNVNNNESNLTTTIIDKVVNSGRVQNPICSLSTTTKSSMSSNWNNITVPICENGVSKKIDANTFTNIILSKYVPPPDDPASCKLPFYINDYVVVTAGPGRNRQCVFNNITLEQESNSDVKFAIYRSSTFDFIRGSGTLVSPVEESEKLRGVGETPIGIRNNTNCLAYVEITTNVGVTSISRSENYSVVVFAKPSLTSKESYTDANSFSSGATNYGSQHAVASFHTKDNVIYGGDWSSNWSSPRTVPVQNTSLPMYLAVQPGESITYYLQFFIVFATTDSSLTTIAHVPNLQISAMSSVKVFRGLYI